MQPFLQTSHWITLAKPTIPKNKMKDVFLWPCIEDKTLNVLFQPADELRSHNTIITHVIQLQWCTENDLYEGNLRKEERHGCVDSAEAKWRAVFHHRTLYSSDYPPPETQSKPCGKGIIIVTPITCSERTENITFILNPLQMKKKDSTEVELMERDCTGEKQ